MADEGLVLGFDVGNGSVKLAVCVRGAWEMLARVPTQPVEALADRLVAAVSAGRREDLAGARPLASSVHPPADAATASAAEDLTGRGLEFFGRDLPVPIEARVREPRRVGTDRLLAALGARALCGAPCVVVSAGTAITVDLVEADGSLAGGIIMPGFGLCARALHEGAAQLPLVEPRVPRSTLGRDTEACIQAGVYECCAGGAARAVGRYVGMIGRPDAPIVCTGSDAELLLPAFEAWSPRHEPLLIFQGMSAALARG